MPRVLLISLRDPSDPMAAHEHLCFAERCRVEPDDMQVHSMTQGLPARWRLQEVDALLFGGSGAYSVLDDVVWIRQAQDLLVDVVELGVPAWASCFGFQGLSVALGGAVERDDARTEMGSTRIHLTEAGRRDGLLGPLPAAFWAQQGHHDRVTVIPEGVTLLATGDVCHEQAFKVDKSPFWASQFHPELTVERTLERFRHYQEHYFEGDAETILRTLESGAETPELGDVLARLVRHEF